MKEGPKNKGGRPPNSATPCELKAEIAEVKATIEKLRGEREFLTARITDQRTKLRRLMARKVAK